MWLWLQHLQAILACIIISQHIWHIPFVIILHHRHQHTIHQVCKFCIINTFTYVELDDFNGESEIIMMLDIFIFPFCKSFYTLNCCAQIIKLIKSFIFRCHIHIIILSSLYCKFTISISFPKSLLVSNISK